ncbi:hypothetical protein SAMN05192561_1271 [Halopenitus malekzadehii]|uniref:Uncharacterized protein n=1 Tax=Halopenitus malekzadehii TaxID=1267564 RepID=A0A1H6JX24_9EURY|nr:hypothetical protein SAMN05192561_1271 [Halopenitus malekzadehii]
MIFLADRANLDKRTLLTRIHSRFQTQAPNEASPIEQVRYHTSAGNKTGVRATISSDGFLDTPHPVAEAELQVSFDFPQTHAYDCYRIQWVEFDRNLIVGWHQDETHVDRGECHFQIDHHGETVQRETAEFLGTHPLNVLDERIDDLVDVLDALTWDDGIPRVPKQAVR